MNEGESNGTVTQEMEAVEIPVVVASVAKGTEGDQLNHHEDDKQKWKGCITYNHISEKGMGLKFVAPSTINGSPVAKLDKIEVEKSE